MSRNQHFRLGQISVIDVSGADADTIVQNLTTNDLKAIGVGEGCESFITDVRGKTIGHVWVFREPEALRLIGPAGQSERVAAHIDRYTIREDATPVVRDGDFEALVITPESAKEMEIGCGGGERPRKATLTLGDASLDAYETAWLGEGTAAILARPDEANRISESLASQLGAAGDESGFHQMRTHAGFPWYGIDLDESNLPQEADRDSAAISFTKGCYLGQETVARLDALGQVQKKLVRWSIAGAVPAAGTALVAGEKTVGRLTSVARAGDGGAIAIGMARRSHFDAGSTASGVAEPDGIAFEATVL